MLPICLRPFGSKRQQFGRTPVGACFARPFSRFQGGTCGPGRCLRATAGRPYNLQIGMHPVGACFARPRATSGRPYIPDTEKNAAKQNPNRSPALAGPVWRGAETKRTRIRTQRGADLRQRSPLRRGVLRSPAGDRRSPLHSRYRKKRGKTMPKPEPNVSGSGLERSRDEADKNPHPKGCGFAAAQSSATRRASLARGRPQVAPTPSKWPVPPKWSAA